VEVVKGVCGECVWSVCGECVWRVCRGRVRSENTATDSGATRCNTYLMVSRAFCRASVSNMAANSSKFSSGEEEEEEEC